MKELPITVYDMAGIDKLRPVPGGARAWQGLQFQDVRLRGGCWFACWTLVLNRIGGPSEIYRQTMIKEMADDNELQESVEIVRRSFITVAADLNLSVENCPAHPAFISFAKLKALRGKGARTFGLFYRNRQIGFVAIEKASDTLYYMEKLAVLPEYRHRGFGKRLMDFVFDYVKQQNGDTVSIGIINESSALKNWYSDYGFVETGIRRFEHLPFVVCFMEKKVG